MRLTTMETCIDQYLPSLLPSGVDGVFIPPQSCFTDKRMC
jgi:hypothetical protein